MNLWKKKKMAKLLCIALQSSLKAIVIFFSFLDFILAFFNNNNDSIYPLESDFYCTSLPMWKYIGKLKIFLPILKEIKMEKNRNKAVWSMVRICKLKWTFITKKPKKKKKASKRQSNDQPKGIWKKK